MKYIIFIFSLLLFSNTLFTQDTLEKQRRNAKFKALGYPSNQVRMERKMDDEGPYYYFETGHFAIIIHLKPDSTFFYERREEWPLYSEGEWSIESDSILILRSDSTFPGFKRYKKFDNKGVFQFIDINRTYVFRDSTIYLRKPSIEYSEVTDNPALQSTHFPGRLDSLKNKDILTLRGVFIKASWDNDGYGVMKRVPQVRLIEEFVRAHRQNKIQVIWIHPQDPRYSNDWTGIRIQRLLGYLDFREVPIWGLDFTVVRSEENELFQLYGSPETPTVILISDTLKW